MEDVTVIELFNMIVNAGGAGVMLWLITRLESRIDSMRAEAREDRKFLAELLTYLIRRDDSQVNIPVMPSQRDKAP